MHMFVWVGVVCMCVNGLVYVCAQVHLWYVCLCVSVHVCVHMSVPTCISVLKAGDLGVGIIPLWERVK